MNTEGFDALRQVERGRGNQTRLAYDDLGPRNWSVQGSAIQGGGGDVAIDVARGEPNQGPAGVASGTTTLSGKAYEEAFQASIA
jgi:hypothetical protein